MSSIYSGSIDNRLDATSGDFFAWCASTNTRPYIRKLGKENMNYQQTSNYPNGGWSKGLTTTAILKFFLSKCADHVAEVEADILLNIAYKAGSHMDAFLHGLYKHEVWIPSKEGKSLALRGAAFLRMFGRGAQQAAKLKKSHFYLVPNHHRLQHIFMDMLEECAVSPYCLNPLHCATQADEDFIGRPSRISRRVNIRLVSLRTIQRSLITIFGKYREAGLIRDATK